MLVRGFVSVIALSMAVSGLLSCESGTEEAGFKPLSGAGGQGGTAGSGGGGAQPPVVDLGGAPPEPEPPTEGLDGPIGGEERPVSVHVPPSYDPSVPMPLVILLHGYGASGGLQELYLNFTAQADERGFLYAYPDGTKDPMGLLFWNATNACCDLTGIGVDDSTYLRRVIDDIKAVFNVDAKRVYLVGHSNGAFMSHRMACDHADAIAAIAALAGAIWEDPSLCQPAEPVSVLSIHGTLDATILYGGGWLPGGTYPGAVETSERWAGLNGCSTTAYDETLPDINIEAVLIGNETERRRYDVGCDPGGLAELWTIKGGGHVPVFNSSFTELVVDFLFAHPKP